MLHPRPQASPESGPLELLLGQALTPVMLKTEAVMVNLTNLGKYSLGWPWWTLARGLNSGAEGGGDALT
jgi:hypothetical protein